MTNCCIYFYIEEVCGSLETSEIRLIISPESPSFLLQTIRYSQRVSGTDFSLYCTIARFHFTVTRQSTVPYGCEGPLAVANNIN